jgi:2-haloacid dehalogenase
MLDIAYLARPGADENQLDLILDYRSNVALYPQFQEFFPGRATELGNEWRTRQFEYTWLRTITGSYADFWRVTEDALHYAAKKVKMGISQGQGSQLMDAYLI